MPNEETDSVYEGNASSSVRVIISFFVGASVGALASYLITRKKMRAEKESEIADIVGYYEGHVTLAYPKEEENQEENDHPREDPSIDELPDIIRQETYVEDMDYQKETVMYYEKDDVLADMYDRELQIKDTIGEEILTYKINEEGEKDYIYFGEDEEDTAYVRNNLLGIDYEVILEHKSYASILGENMED